MDMINGMLTTSISEFKKNPNAEVKRAKGLPFAVLTNNKPGFFVIPAKEYEEYLEYLFDLEMEKTVRERLKRIESGDESFKEISWDELSK